MQDEGGWRVALDLFLIGVFGLQGLVGRLAQQVVVRAHVGERRVHRDDRIEKDLEVGAGRGVGEMGRGGAGQVSPGRRAHDPQFLDVPLGGVLAHDPQGLLGVAQGHLVVPVGHPIAQHGVGDAHPVHPVRHHRPLVLHRQAPIAATRAGDDCQPVPMLGGKDGQGRFRHVERAALRLRSHLVVVGGAVWP